MNKKSFLILCCVFAVVMIAAAVLYSTLGSQVELGGLVTQPPVQSTEPAETSAPAQTTAPAEAGEADPAESTAATDAAKKQENPAPDVPLLDMEGNEVRLADFVGKPIILNFWASWCGPCKSEMPDLEEAYLKYGEEIHFLMVNCTDGGRETVETATKFIQDAGYTFPVYFDTTMEASYTYGASSIPLTYFIDREGNLVAYYMRAMSASILQQGIDLVYTPSEAE